MSQTEYDRDPVRDANVQLRARRASDADLVVRIGFAVAGVAFGAVLVMMGASAVGPGQAFGQVLLWIMAAGVILASVALPFARR